MLSAQVLTDRRVGKIDEISSGAVSLVSMNECKQGARHAIISTRRGRQTAHPGVVRHSITTSKHDREREGKEG